MAARTVGFAFLAPLLGCQPDSIAAARDQLERGPARTVLYHVPIVRDSVDPASLLPEDRDTILGALLAVRLDPESLTVTPGEMVELQALNLRDLVVNIDPGTLAAPPGTQIGVSADYPLLQDEPRLADVDTVLAAGGMLVMVTANRLPMEIAYAITLAGFTDASGDTLAGSGTVPAAPGDGSFRDDTLTFDLAGVAIVPSEATAELEATATLPPTPVDPALGDSALVQTGGGTLEVQALVGRLDPASIPELRVETEEWREMPADAVDFGDFQDFLADTRLHSATLALRVENAAEAPVELTDVVVGLAPVGPGGDILRDASGDPLYEEDESGAPILVPVTEPDGSPVQVAAAAGGLPAVTTVDLDAPDLADRLVHLLLEDRSTAVVGSGTVTIGDGTQARITRDDRVDVRVDLAVGLDLTLPDTGGVFTRTSVEDGLSVDSASADQLVGRLVRAAAVAAVVNGLPFGVVVEIAYAPGEREGGDVFGLPDRVELDPITLDAPPLDAGGRAAGTATDTVQIALDGPEVRVLLADRFTAALRVRLLPGTGGGGRTAVRVADRVVVGSEAVLEFRAGGASP